MVNAVSTDFVHDVSCVIHATLVFLNLDGTIVMEEACERCMNRYAGAGNV